MSVRRPVDRAADRAPLRAGGRFAATASGLSMETAVQASRLQAVLRIGHQRAHATTDTGMIRGRTNSSEWNEPGDGKKLRRQPSLTPFRAQSMGGTEYLNFRCADGVVQVPRASVEKMRAIQEGMMELMEADGSLLGGAEVPVPLAAISRGQLLAAVAFAQNPELMSAEYNKVPPDEPNKSVHFQHLLELMEAGNYLWFMELQQAIAKAIAVNFMNTTDVTQIRKSLYLPTVEDDAQKYMAEKRASGASEAELREIAKEMEAAIEEEKKFSDGGRKDEGSSSRDPM